MILGIKITRTECGISLDQSHYIEKILKIFNYFDCKPACAPYDPSVKFSRTLVKVLNKQSMQASLVAFVILMIALSSYNAYIVRLLCWFTSSRSIDNWNEVPKKDHEHWITP